MNTIVAAGLSLSPFGGIRHHLCFSKDETIARSRRSNSATREASSDGLAIDLMAFEQRKGNRIPLGGATCIIRM
jgi:hypothetical protein